MAPSLSRLCGIFQNEVKGLDPKATRLYLNIWVPKLDLSFLSKDLTNLIGKFLISNMQPTIPIPKKVLMVFYVKHEDALSNICNPVIRVYSKMKRTICG